MGVDGSEMSNPVECQRCGRRLRSPQALWDHLHGKDPALKCQVPGRKRPTGVVHATAEGETVSGPQSLRDLYMED